ncbi:hypothetical protein V8F20_003419 [Naviculisporaceae sp. PSN 640]
MDSKATTFKPLESNPPETTTSASTATTSASAPAPTAPETSSTQNATSPQPPNENDTQSATPNTTNLAAPQPAITDSARNSTSSIELRRLSDRALPPLPPGQVQVQHRDAGPVVDAGPVIDEPPPEYMSIPHNNNNAAPRSAGVGAGGRAPRPENYVINLEDLYESPDYVDCPHCRTRQKTTVRYQPTTETNVAAVACCLFCGILPGIIPFCCNWFNDIEHVCPHCVKVVARMPHDGKMQAVLPQPSKYQASQFQPAGAGGAAGNGNSSAAGNSNGNVDAAR